MPARGTVAGDCVTRRGGEVGGPIGTIALGNQAQRDLVEVGSADQGGDHAALRRFLGDDLAIYVEAIKAEADIGVQVRSWTVAAVHLQLQMALGMGREQRRT